MPLQIKHYVETVGIKEAFCIFNECIIWGIQYTFQIEEVQGIGCVKMEKNERILKDRVSFNEVVCRVGISVKRVMNSF